jgi:hypothetical protein
MSQPFPPPTRRAPQYRAPVPSSNRGAALLPTSALGRNPPLATRPIGYYVHRLQEEERKEYERLKVENAALKRQLSLPQ